MILRNMSNKCVRIFTYFPNPRIWKALIAANLLDVELEVRGDKPNNLHVATQVNILDTPINIVFFFTFILDDSFHELFAK